MLTTMRPISLDTDKQIYAHPNNPNLKTTYGTKRSTKKLNGAMFDNIRSSISVNALVPVVNGLVVANEHAVATLTVSGSSMNEEVKLALIQLLILEINSASADGFLSGFVPDGQKVEYDDLLIYPAPII